MQESIEKLMRAGWIEGSATIDREDKNYLLNIKWTDAGRKSLQHFYYMVSQIEAASKSRLTSEDLVFLKSMAEVTQIQRGNEDSL